MSTSDALNTAAKVDFLAQPAAYPDSPALVEVRETHMSWLFLTPVRVYKLKKPLRYDFLDFSTLGRRLKNIGTALQQVLSNHARCFAERVRKACIVEAHGDLRPEHIYLGNPPAIIDCLEFNRNLRLLDPVDELGFLALECERPGAGAIGEQLFAGCDCVRADAPPALIHFYRSFRALLWAKLAILHLERHPQSEHAKWRQRSDEYLRLAERHIELTR